MMPIMEVERKEQMQKLHVKQETQSKLMEMPIATKPAGIVTCLLNGTQGRMEKGMLINQEKKKKSIQT